MKTLFHLFAIIGSLGVAVAAVLSEPQKQDAKTSQPEYIQKIARAEMRIESIEERQDELAQNVTRLEAECQDLWTALIRLETKMKTETRIPPEKIKESTVKPADTLGDAKKYIQIVSHRTFEDLDGNVWVVGEVKNNASETIAQTNIRVFVYQGRGQSPTDSFFEGRGQSPTDSFTGSIKPTNLEPGQIGMFKIELSHYSPPIRGVRTSRLARGARRYSLQIEDSSFIR